MAQVPGLQTCLAQCDSDKVKERDAGRQRLRDIFGNPQNLDLFQESASRDGGEGACQGSSVFPGRALTCHHAVRRRT